MMNEGYRRNPAKRLKTGALRRVVCLALCLLLAPAALAENVQDSLVVGLLSNRTVEVRPLVPQERDILSLYQMVYESLVSIDDNGLPQPLLCETWTESGQGNTWTFTLRENIVFSDGTPLTANDVVASLQYILALANNEEAADKGFYQNLRYVVSSVKALDDRTVQIKAKRPYYGLLYGMTFPVVPAAQVDAPSPLGTGPYQISVFEPGGYMWLTVNANWWQTEPQVKEIMASFYQSNADLISAYEYARVDAAFTRSVAAAQYKSGINSLSIAYSTRQLECLLLNHGEYPLESLAIRQAIRAAIDADAISRDVYMGMTVDADTPIPSNSWLYLDNESTFAYNFELAQRLLEQEGWSDLDGDGILDKVVGEGQVKHLRLRLYVYEDPLNNVRFETANRIADMLGALKIKVKVTAMTYDEMKASLSAGSFDLALCAFQMDQIPDPGFLLMKRNTGNYGRYVSSEMTSLCETLRACADQTSFAQAMAAIQQKFADDVPFICLFYRAGAVLTRKMYSTVRDIREFELLRGVEAFGR